MINAKLFSRIPLKVYIKKLSVYVSPLNNLSLVVLTQNLYLSVALAKVYRQVFHGTSPQPSP